MRFGTIRHRQEAPIYRIAFTRDDKVIVTDGDDSQLRVWDARDGKLIRRIPVPIGALSDFSLCSDAKTVVATGTNFVNGKGTIRHVVFHELETGRQVSQSSWVESLFGLMVALDPDRQLLVTGSRAGQLQIVRVATGTEIARVVLENEEVRSLAFSANRDRLAVISAVKDDAVLRRRRLRVFDTKNASDLRSVASFDEKCREIAFSPDGTTFAISADGAKLVLLNVLSRERKQFHDAFIQEIAFSADGHRIAGIHMPRDEVVFWDALAPKFIGLLKAPTSLAGQLAFSFDGQTFAANGGANVLHLYEVAAKTERHAAGNAHADRVNAALVTPDGEKLITASADRTIRVWSMTTGRQFKVLNQPDGVATISLSRDGRSLVAGMAFSPVIRCCDLEGGESSAIRMGSEEELNFAVACSQHGQLVLTLSGNGILRRWNSADRRMLNEVSLKSFLVPGESLLSAIFFADGAKLATTARSSGLHVVDVETGKEIGRVGRAKLVAHSPDQKTLAITRSGLNYVWKRMGNDQQEPVITSATIVLVDANTCREIRQMEVPGSEVWSLAFSPDGKTLAATSGWETGQIHLYEVATGREFRTIDTPAIRTSALTFTPDGSKLVCGMADTSVLVWNVEASP